MCYTRENAGSKAKMVEIRVILGRNAQISRNSWLTSLSLVKIFSSVEFCSFPSTKDKAKAFVSVSIYEKFNTIKKLTHAHESTSEYDTYCA